LSSRLDVPMFSPDAEPSRKERGHRGVRPCHPNWKAFGLDGAGSSSGPGPRRFRSRHDQVGSAFEGGGAGVAEGLVALADSLLEAGLGGALLERVALLGVAGDAVEDGAQDLGLV